MKRETPRLYVRIKNKKQNKKPTKPSATVLTHSQSLSLG